MNVLADRLATLTAEMTHHTQEYRKLPNLGMDIVRYNGIPICGNIYSALYNGLLRARLMEYYSKKLHLTQEALNTVDFISFSKARKTTNGGMNKFLTKWISDTLATGVILQRRQHRVFNRCPRCNEWGEDKLHVVVCWDIRAKVIWEKNMEVLQSLMASTSTHPDISTFIINGLRHFRKHPRARGQQTRYIQQDWKREQEEIGWLNFLTGFISKKMVQKQDTYYNSRGLRNRGHTWAAKIIQQCWILVRNMWIGRNDVLHKKEIINEISGEALLDIEIEREYNSGVRQLPQSVHKWFQLPLDDLLAQSIEQKKGWLLIIRTVKESLEIAEYSIFTSSAALRKWIGLGK
jgi:hypothetical protein